MRIEDIQKLNKERADKWHNGDFRNWSGLEWAGAFCGEAGEAANVSKKIKRLEDDLQGNQFSEHQIETLEELKYQLGIECADAFLYLCLLASRYDLDLSTFVKVKFNLTSAKMGFPERI